ncbi:mammalian ependymin-related protein 1 [Nematostella vectensis]|uniref:mammalian ependymin-related protein 1 n=1 Tax=Nematostella vectensis TaxID=45351 RepID=UPI00207792CD|nr:mammalian ependymin-related protein 1 [Nematostella vectensis]
MKFFLLIVVVILVCVYVEGKTSSSTPCKVPHQFVGNYGIYKHTHDGNNTANTGLMYFDGDNQRIRVDIISKGVPYKIVQLYTEKVQYVMFKYKGKDMCIILPFTKPFTPVEIPSTSLELEHGRIGSAKHGLDVRRFYGTKDGVHFIVTVTADECMVTDTVARVPMQFIAYFSLTNISRFEVTDADYAHPSDCKPVGHAPEHHARMAREAPSEFN